MYGRTLDTLPFSLADLPLGHDYDGQVKFVKLNTDENPLVSGKYGIRSIPTLLLFKGGEAVGQVVGFRPKSDLAKHLDEVLA